MKVIGSDICKDCREVRALLAEKNISYQWVDITENTDNMRYFLRLRDTQPIFTPVKEEGRIGIPCFQLADGTLTLNLWEALEARR